MSESDEGSPLPGTNTSEHSDAEEDENESQKAESEPGFSAGSEQSDRSVLSEPDEAEWNKPDEPGLEQSDDEDEERTWESAMVLCLMVDACQPQRRKCFNIISESEMPRLKIAEKERTVFHTFIDLLLVGQREHKDSTSAAEFGARPQSLVPALQLKRPDSLFEIMVRIMAIRRRIASDAFSYTHLTQPTKRIV